MTARTLQIDLRSRLSSNSVKTVLHVHRVYNYSIIRLLVGRAHNDKEQVAKPACNTPEARQLRHHVISLTLQELMKMLDGQPTRGGPLITNPQINNMTLT